MAAATKATSGKTKTKKKPVKCPKGKKLKRGRCVKARAGSSEAHRAKYGAGRASGERRSGGSGK
jgi:hypothetical protein